MSQPTVDLRRKRNDDQSLASRRSDTSWSAAARAGVPTGRVRPRPFGPARLLEQVSLAQPSIDSEGRSVLYVRRTIERKRYRERIWKVATDGGEPVCVAAFGRHCTRPRFSPDGKSILFLSDQHGLTAPYVMPADGGDPRPIGRFPGPALAAEWTADGRSVAVLAASGVERFVRGARTDPVVRVIRQLNWRRDGIGIRDQVSALWLVDDTGGAQRRLTTADVDVAGIFPAPDGGIAFVADMSAPTTTEEHPQAFLIAPDGGPVTDLPTLDDQVFGLAWSPGGRLALVGGSIGYRVPGLYVAAEIGTAGAAAPVRRLGAHLDRPVTHLVNNDLSGIAYSQPTILWTDEDHVVAKVTSEGYGVPHRFGLDGSTVPLAPPQSIAGDMALGGGRLVAIAIDLSGRDGAAPGPEVCLVEGGELHPLTTHGSSWLTPYIRPASSHLVPTRDGRRIRAWSLPGRTRAGAGGLDDMGACVLEIHGGAPGSMRSPYPMSTHLALADAGINVIWAEPRGSGGFGQQHCPDDASSWEPAAEDLIDVVHWAIASGLAQPGRIGVTGASYGGFMTTWLLGREPSLFAAGVIEVPLTDMVSGLPSADQYCHSDLAFPHDWHRMLDLSPYRWIGDTNAATLIIHSDDDLRCPPTQSDIIFDILVRAGKTVEMLRYPREPHRMFWVGRPDRRVDRLERIVEWFRRHLNGPMCEPRTEAAPGSGMEGDR